MLRANLSISAVAALLSACSALTSVRGRAPGGAGHLPVAQASTGLLDLKGVIHCHSFLSHDSRGTVAQISAAATEVGAHFLVMTDHITPVSVPRGTRGFVGDTLWIVGAELRCPDSQGSIVAFPLRHYVRPWPTLTEIVDDVAQQGGVCVCAHPDRWPTLDAPGFIGMEVVNLHAAAIRADKLGMLLTGLFLPVSHLLQFMSARPTENLQRYDTTVQRHPFALIGGNDAHANVRLFGPLGGTIGDYREVFRTLTTHVLATTFDEAGIVAALRSGRSYVSFDLRRDATGFDFHIDGAAGVVPLGGTAKLTATTHLHVITPARARVVVVRDGIMVARQETTQLDLPVASPGRYRVEVEHLDGQSWILSSAISVVADG